MGKRGNERRKQVKKLNREHVEAGYEYRQYDRGEDGSLIKPKITKAEHRRYALWHMTVRRITDNAMASFEEAQPELREMAKQDIINMLSDSWKQTHDAAVAELDAEMFGQLEGEP